MKNGYFYVNRISGVNLCETSSTHVEGTDWQRLASPSHLLSLISTSLPLPKKSIRRPSSLTEARVSTGGNQPSHRSSATAAESTGTQQKSDSVADEQSSIVSSDLFKKGLIFEGIKCQSSNITTGTYLVSKRNSKPGSRREGRRTWLVSQQGWNISQDVLSVVHPLSMGSLQYFLPELTLSTTRMTSETSQLHICVQALRSQNLNLNCDTHYLEGGVLALTQSLSRSHSNGTTQRRGWPERIHPD
ncbi:hypothetical protein HA466_0310570 [Hirschfeldia incana]|nr:hypothetical protein HA466_0310570 [Hirschfeldia incana]KAJ0230096.1 hypothetical protein HA466_0310570 [Hirschfeldia incana]KAJ0230097.1 hypothetical protein HA466_0310570 [Hirschfeldia incana]